MVYELLQKQREETGMGEKKPAVIVSANNPKVYFCISMSLMHPNTMQAISKYPSPYEEWFVYAG